MKYFTGAPCHKGHVDQRYTKTGHCVTCTVERNRSPNKVSYRKQHKAANYERVSESNRRAYAAKPEQYRLYNKQYRQANAAVLKPKECARTMRRLASKKQRTPAWLTAEDLWMMEQAYELAKQRELLFGFKWDVDHVIPLQGVTVSGLHVPLNLQVIPMSINRSKGAKYG
jgi:hypothetical protein